MKVVFTKQSVLIYLSVMLWVLSGCTKERVQQEDIYNTSGIAAVANNNFNLTLFSMALQSTGYTAFLSEKGPFTVLAASNLAFNQAGIRNAADIKNAAVMLSGTIPYHILKGGISFDTLPMIFNRVFVMENGFPLYVSRWGNARDTAITVNGLRLAGNAIPTTNGNIYLLDQLLTASANSSVKDIIGNNADLTFFNAAVKHSGLEDLFVSASENTVFAPSNQAFMNAGITSTDSIYNMDPLSLKQLLKAHITTGRYFINDYILLADVATNAYTEKMLDSSEVLMKLLPLAGIPDRFRTIVLNRQNTSGLQTANLVKIDLTASNGVVNIIDNIFIP